MTKSKKYSDHSQYDPKIHTKTKGGLGFGMKKGIKSVSEPIKDNITIFY